MMRESPRHLWEQERALQEAGDTNTRALTSSGPAAPEGRLRVGRVCGTPSRLGGQQFGDVRGRQGLSPTAQEGRRLLGDVHHPPGHQRKQGRKGVL